MSRKTRLRNLQRHLSLTRARREIWRREHKIRFHQITDELISDVPHFFESPEFRLIRKDDRVKKFVYDFWVWNEMVLWLVSSISRPYIELQKMLAVMLRPYLGQVVLDLGCGTGNFFSRLFEDGDALSQVCKIFAVDIDWKSLVQVPTTLQEAGYRGRVALIQGSTMSELPVWSADYLSDVRKIKPVDTIVSSLGGLMYAGWRFQSCGHDRIEMISEGRRALAMCLAEVNRILPQDGILAFSAPKPNPDWEEIRKVSIQGLLKDTWHDWRNLPDFIKAVRLGKQARQLSEFMHQIEHEGHAHYLSVTDWTDYLGDAGFQVIDSSEGEYYAGQGLIVIAEKVRNLI